MNDEHPSALIVHRSSLNMRRYLPATLCLLLAVGSALSGYAVISQSQTQTRGLDLGRPVTLYGINVDLLGSPDRDSQLTALKETGFGWVRQTFDWRNMDWAAAEALAPPRASPR